MTIIFRYCLWLVMVLGLLIAEVRAQSLSGSPSSNPGTALTQTNLRLPAVVPLAIDPASRVWLDGSANIVDFTCVAGIIDSRGSLNGFNAQAEGGRPHGEVQLQVSIPIKNLNCGKPPINRDMRRTLNSDEHPFIVYTLGENKLVDPNNRDLNGSFDIETFGELKISGKSRTEKIIVKGQFIGTWQFRVTGAHTIQMSDYGLEPPSPMMGLIKVNDELTVHFDVILTLKDMSILR